MEESTHIWQTVLTLTLLFGGLAAFLAARIIHKKHPVQAELLVQEISGRALDTKPFSILFGTLLLLYVLAGATGQFFYEEQKPLVRLVVQWIIYALFAAGLILNSRPGKVRFGLSYRNLKWLPIGFALYLAAAPVIMVTSYAYQLVLNLITGSEQTAQDIAQFVRGDISWLQAGYILTAVIGAPIYEEVIFRGILFPFILKRSSLKPALAFTAVLFASVHMHIPSLLPIGLLSVILCLVYLRTASLWACIGLHMMFNMIGIFALNITGWLLP